MEKVSDVIQEKYLTAGVLGRGELVAADVWPMAVTVLRIVGTAGWLRTVKKCVISRVLDGR